MKKALLAVDLQNDFYEDGALAVPAASKINQKVNELLESEEYEIIVASQDWHPQNHRSFASVHGEKAFTPYDKEEGLGPVLWPDHCVQKSEGAEFNSEVKTHKFDYILRKGTDPEVDSYSAFQDNDGSDLGLAALLKSFGIEEVDICGLAYDVCVKYTALDSVKNAFKTNIIQAASAAVNPDEIEKCNQELKQAGVNLI
ncbi:bifunctional nicotinamidase/pyrazinamidase [Halanaerobium hydrogeniformans]|uniref:nicotinamidase n=1 Tax=Halanaerobium hydrogeniformans TaxID=656519 RepID=E4RKQ9_HALHG|nr:bifunctional nicotinamidase/pyrazinamidase [Halanaerobium hydrogeniformans]ADQ14729.1 Nicotinamidase [Halanaerobium hydrogeniformans]